jgi:hypothetical protein
VLRVAAEQQARLIVVHDPGTVSGRLLSASWDFVTHHAPCHVLVDRSALSRRPMALLRLWLWLSPKRSRMPGS